MWEPRWGFKEGVAFELGFKIEFAKWSRWRKKAQEARGDWERMRALYITSNTATRAVQWKPTRLAWSEDLVRRGSELCNSVAVFLFQICTFFPHCSGRAPQLQLLPFPLLVIVAWGSHLSSKWSLCSCPCFLKAYHQNTCFTFKA